MGFYSVGSNNPPVLPIKGIVHLDLPGFSSFYIGERGSLSQWRASLPLEGKVPLQEDYVKILYYLKDIEDPGIFQKVKVNLW